mmetsp:Transcript_26125/g.52511  ORF Transcript_26125/g.52511 Transcript_26125/m.52511 type:complete len:164 (+) Transcript_26125:233-724(+)
MSTFVVAKIMDIVIVDRELAFALRGTWAMHVVNVPLRTLKLVVFAIQKRFVPMTVQGLVSVIIKQESANAMYIGKERIVPDPSALNITNFVLPAMKMDALNAKMDSVLTRQQSGESNVRPVGDLIHVVVLAVKMLVRRVLICCCCQFIDLGDVRMIHLCRWMS